MEHSSLKLESQKKINELEMQLRQEKDKRLLAEKYNKPDEDAADKLQQLESKLHEARRTEMELLEKIKGLEEDLQGKDEEIENLLTNLESNELMDRLLKISREKEDLEAELGNFWTTDSRGTQDASKP